MICFEWGTPEGDANRLEDWRQLFNATVQHLMLAQGAMCHLAADGDRLTREDDSRYSAHRLAEWADGSIEGTLSLMRELHARVCGAPPPIGFDFSEEEPTDPLRKAPTK